MKYLRKFATEAEIADIEKPSVVLIADNNKVLYYPKLKSGVYVQHIDGTLYKHEDWASKAFAHDEANGVAIIANECSFVISLDSIKTGSMPWSSDAENAIEGVAIANNETEAIMDFNGVSNTQIIASNTSSSAAKECLNYIFKNGANGYLGAAGEWQKALDNKTEIDAIFVALGKNIITQYGSWTSTQNSDSQAWKVYWPAPTLAPNYKGSRVPVYPFTTL